MTDLVYHPRVSIASAIARRPIRFEGRRGNPRTGLMKAGVGNRHAVA
ncbi:hypothetical protein [Halalkalicoccus subterraneus]|nr:hypothetical protein [Halalkalicoccus subterraneus]